MRLVKITAWLWLTLCGLCITTWPVQAVTKVSDAPAERAIIAANIREQQSLGRVIMDPAGRFMLYEWKRPYNWTPDAKDLSRAAASRPQTTLYRVLIPDDWRWIDEPTSEQLFPMLPGATYWLGELSPDGEWVSVYQLDRDDKTVKAGVAATRHIIEADKPPKIVWFDLPPDDNRFDHPPTWAADGKSLTYPVKGGKLARADAATGRATLCTGCNPSQLYVPPAVGAATLDHTDVPANAQLVANSADGQIGAFILDTPQKLGLYLRSMRATSALDVFAAPTPGATVTLFENNRN